MLRCSTRKIGFEGATNKRLAKWAQRAQTTRPAPRLDAACARPVSGQLLRRTKSRLVSTMGASAL